MDFKQKTELLQDLIDEYVQLKKFFDTSNEASFEEIEYRSEILIGLVPQIKTLYNELKRLIKADDKQRFEDLYATFSTTYMSFIASVRAWLNKNKPAQHSDPDVSLASHKKTSKPKVKFPAITMPEFDGTLEKWLQFRDTFESMVHNNEALTKMEKYHYLLTSMKLPTGQTSILSTFAVTENCYEPAWEAVKDRYNDTRKLKAQHFTTLLTIKKMTSETPAELRRILDTFSATITTLKQLDANWEDLLVHVVQYRLDEQTLKDWQKFNDDDEHPRWDDLRDFLKSQWRRLDQIQPTQKKVAQKPFDKPPTHSTTKSHAASSSTQANNATHTSFVCSLCKENHKLYHCQKFKALSTSDRFKHVNAAKLCHNCFSPEHQSKQCKGSHCKLCDRFHNTMIHFDKGSSTQQVPNQGSSGSNPQGSHGNESNRSQAPQLNASSEPFRPFAHNNLSHSTQSFALHSQTLLSTVQVKVMDSNGNYQMCRALLDSGSQDNYIKYEFAAKLGLRLNDACITVRGINGKTSFVRHTADTTISSTYSAYTKELKGFLVLPCITGILPGIPINRDELSIPKDCYLADPTFHQPADVDMLLGTRIYYQVELDEKIRLPEGPIMKLTEFGWVFGGIIDSDKPNASTFLSCFSQVCNVGVEDIDEKLERFMELESFDPTKKLLSSEEKYCEDRFEQTTKRDDSGRYIVQLPEKSNIKELGNNFNSAYRQFIHQEKTRQLDPELNKMYIDYMTEYIESKDMEEIDAMLQNEGYFLPHHGVKKMTSTTTKLRPVFNASSKSQSGLSLNDCLCVGPTVQPELFDIMIRFRESPYVLKCDIEKMYRQVLVDESQRKYQKILWRTHPSLPLKQYHLNALVFGICASANLATRTLYQIATDYEEQFPEAAAIIKSSFYVDDLMFGCLTIEQGLKLRDQIRFILSASHMPSRKWGSNDERLLQDIHPKDLEVVDDKHKFIKTLGHNWFPQDDQLSLNFKKMSPGPITKASVLSEIASIYDPLGIVGPVVLKAKLFMKTLWQLKMKWNDSLPDDVKQQWEEFQLTIPALNEVFVDRHTVIMNPVKVELHGFSDASELAYGAVIYIRAMDFIGNVQVSLVCSKSRVSPPKTKTIARLELCAATLLSKLTRRLMSITTLTFDEVTLWSDSLITLYWILSQASKLSTFVGNRVAVIQELTLLFIWKHIRGEFNPADVISRGLFPHEIRYSDIWWNGPPFFRLPIHQWPESLLTINEEDPVYTSELRKSHVTTQADTLFNLIDRRFNKLYRLVKVFAYIKRFVHNAKLKTQHHIERKTGALSLDEREEAMSHMIRIVQKTMFPQEYQFLKKLTEDPANNENVCGAPTSEEKYLTKSPIFKLAPLMYKDELIIRVGGRLQASPELTENQKHPIVLPEGRFAKLIIRSIHLTHAHPGNLAMLSFVRESFWPLGAKSIIRKVAYECITCFRVKPKLGTQFMGSLPPARVTMKPPFSSTSVDYAGHINLRTSYSHKATIVKAYVAMFKCMSTGAIHLEAVTSLSKEAFIAAFDRFISRRGLSTEIFSDNGTNFHGADNEFKKILKEIEPKLSEHITQLSIQWHFTCPLAPHAGGYYESGIKTMKHHLIRVMENRTFDFEQLSTVLCKIEAVVNSRPITPMSEDPNDLRALTPGHFLIGRPLLTKPERNYKDVRENRVDKWNQLQQIQQKFWSAWYHDYLHHRQERPNDFREKKNYKVGEMVIIKDDNLPTLKWLIGRISHVFPAKDGVVRNVRVRTMRGDKEHYLDRHVRYLCLLPKEEPIEPPQNVPETEDRNLNVDTNTCAHVK